VASGRDRQMARMREIAVAAIDVLAQSAVSAETPVAWANRSAATAS
jgi:hypothetical protein